MRGLIVFCIAGLFCTTSVGGQDLPRIGSFETYASLESIFGASQAPELGRALPADKNIRFQIFIPSSYNPADPPGVLVYTSPMRNGDLPDGWAGIMEEENLIWISAEESGNGKPDVRRMTEAIAALALIRRDYATDQGRAYAAGLSRGGQITSLLMEYFPDVFDGALFICGAEDLGDVDEAVLSVMAQRRFVFLTGTQDFARFRTREAYQSYKDAGLHMSRLMEVKGMGHRNPDAEDLADAVAYLDGREDTLEP